MALLSDVLTTVARLCNYMKETVPTAGSADEASLQATINAVTKWIQKYTGHTFKKTAYTNEEYSTERGQTLNLEHFPVISSLTVKLERRNSQMKEDDWEEVDSEYYVVDYESGIIELMGGLVFYRTKNGYRVTYTAGYDFDNATTFLGDTAAADVEIAAWMICQDIQNSKGKSSDVKSERLGDYSVTYADALKSIFDNPQAKAILDQYKDIGDELSVLTPLQSV